MCSQFSASGSKPFLNTQKIIFSRQMFNLKQNKKLCRRAFALFPEMQLLTPRSKQSFVHFHAYFASGLGRGSSSLGLKIPHDQQQSQIVLLAPHQDGTKQGRRCSHSTWSFGRPVDRFPVGVASRNCPANRSWDILDTWPKQRSCKVSHRELFANIASLPLIRAVGYYILTVITQDS